jgi:hypothetical protein
LYGKITNSLLLYYLITSYFKFCNMLTFVSERDHWGDPGVDGTIILRWIFRKWDGGIWTGLGWVGIETGGGHL